MTSEWMKVMLDEIARKKSVVDSERVEFERRRAEQGSVPGAGPAPPADTPTATPAARSRAADDSA